MNTLLFPHIPKTAGSYVKSYLTSLVGEEKIFWKNDSSYTSIFTNSQKFDKVKVFGGHRLANSDYFRHIASVRLSHIFIFTFRHPVVRFLSHFYHSKRNKNHSLYDELCLTDHLLTLNTPFIKRNSRQQLQYINLNISGQSSLEIDDLAKQYKNIIIADSSRVTSLFDIAILLLGSDQIKGNIDFAKLFTNSAPDRDSSNAKSIDSEISFYKQKLNCSAKEITSIEDILADELDFYNVLISKFSGFYCCCKNLKL